MHGLINISTSIYQAQYTEVTDHLWLLSLITLCTSLHCHPCDKKENWHMFQNCIFVYFYYWVGLWNCITLGGVSQQSCSKGETSGALALGAQSWRIQKNLWNTKVTSTVPWPQQTLCIILVPLLVHIYTFIKITTITVLVGGALFPSFVWGAAIYGCVSQSKIFKPHLTSYRSFWTLPISYSLPPWSRVLLENLTGLNPVKKFSAFYGNPIVH